MINSQVYRFPSYKQFLLEAIAERNQRGFLSDLAKAARCSHSYLSQAIRGKPNLTPDQALAIGEFLGLGEAEADYFFTLVLRERASTPQLRASLDKKLLAIKEDALSTSTAVRPSGNAEIPAIEKDSYFSHWLPSAVHMLTSCESFQTPGAIAARLKVSPQEVTSILLWLAELGLVKKQKDRFRHSGKSFHLPTQEIHNKVNHLNWRLRGLESSATPSAIHYTSVFSISLKDWDQLRSDLLAFIEGQRKKIQSSGGDDAFVFCCDLFKM